MKKNKTVEYGKYGLMFLIPFFLVFLIFQLYPLIYTFYNSLVYSAKNGRYVTTSVRLGNFTIMCLQRPEVSSGRHLL